MSEPFVITREAWKQLQDQIRSIEEAITGGLDGRSSLRSRVEHLEHDLGSVRANLAALEGVAGGSVAWRPVRSFRLACPLALLSSRCWAGTDDQAVRAFSASRSLWPMMTRAAVRYGDAVSGAAM
jgi:hypothetical protein